MNIKNLFKYKPQTEYDFSIQQSIDFKGSRGIVDKILKIQNLSFL